MNKLLEENRAGIYVQMSGEVKAAVPGIGTCNSVKAACVASSRITNDDNPNTTTNGLLSLNENHTLVSNVENNCVTDITTKPKKMHKSQRRLLTKIKFALEGKDKLLKKPLLTFEDQSQIEKFDYVISLAIEQAPKEAGLFQDCFQALIDHFPEACSNVPPFKELQERFDSISRIKRIKTETIMANPEGNTEEIDDITKNPLEHEPTFPETNELTNLSRNQYRLLLKLKNSLQNKDALLKKSAVTTEEQAQIRKFDVYIRLAENRAITETTLFKEHFKTITSQFPEAYQVRSSSDELTNVGIDFSPEPADFQQQIDDDCQINVQQELNVDRSCTENVSNALGLLSNQIDEEVNTEVSANSKNSIPDFIPLIPNQANASMDAECHDDASTTEPPLEPAGVTTDHNSEIEVSQPTCAEVETSKENTFKPYRINLDNLNIPQNERKRFKGLLRRFNRFKKGLENKEKLILKQHLTPEDENEMVRADKNISIGLGFFSRLENPDDFEPLRDLKAKFLEMCESSSLNLIATNKNLIENQKNDLITQNDEGLNMIVKEKVLDTELTQNDSSEAVIIGKIVENNQTEVHKNNSINTSNSLPKESENAKDVVEQIVENHNKILETSENSTPQPNLNDEIMVTCLHDESTDKKENSQNDQDLDNSMEDDSVIFIPNTTEIITIDDTSDVEIPESSAELGKKAASKPSEGKNTNKVNPTQKQIPSKTESEANRFRTVLRKKAELLKKKNPTKKEQLEMINYNHQIREALNNPDKFDKKTFNALRTQFKEPCKNVPSLKELKALKTKILNKNDENQKNQFNRPPLLTDSQNNNNRSGNGRSHSRVAAFGCPPFADLWRFYNQTPYETQNIWSNLLQRSETMQNCRMNPRPRPPQNKVQPKRRRRNGSSPSAHKSVSQQNNTPTEGPINVREPLLQEAPASSQAKPQSEAPEPRQIPVLQQGPSQSNEELSVPQLVQGNKEIYGPSCPSNSVHPYESRNHDQPPPAPFVARDKWQNSNERFPQPVDNVNVGRIPIIANHLEVGSDLQNPPESQETVVIAIADESALYGLIPEDRWKVLEAAIFHELIKYMHAWPDAPMPSFDDAGWSNNLKLVKCNNRFSLNWLSDVIPRLRNLWPDARLEIVPTVEQIEPAWPLAKVLIPHNVSPHIAFDLMQRQNPTIPTRDWRILKVIPAFNGDIYIFQINKIAEDLLYAVHGKMSWGMRNVYMYLKKRFPNDGNLHTFEQQEIESDLRNEYSQGTFRASS